MALRQWYDDNPSCGEQAATPQPAGSVLQCKSHCQGKVQLFYLDKFLLLQEHYNGMEAKCSNFWRDHVNYKNAKKPGGV